jgi:ABC-type sugar transport system ATPase subunit
MASLSLVEVSKRFGSVHAVHASSIEVQDGEFLVLVGPSGCGKSTLLRMIAGLETVSGGRVLLDGRDVTDLAPRDRDMAMVFQDYALYPHMSVAENLGFALRMQGLPRDQVASRVRGTAELLELGALLERRPRALSGGQRQRVALGRALVRQPSLFLFDEPLSNLDAKLRGDMRLEIRSLQRRTRTTSVYVTHDQVEAMTMADRIVVLRDGRIQQIGHPMEVYQRPANVFVATFIGSPPMNLLPCTAAEHGAALPSGPVLPWPRGRSVRAGTAVTLGIRAEHVVPDNGAGPGFAFRSDVQHVEDHGADTMAVVTLAGCRMTVRVPPGRLRAGDRDVGFRLDPEHLHVFAGSDGVAV